MRWPARMFPSRSPQGIICKLLLVRTAWEGTGLLAPSKPECSGVICLWLTSPAQIRPVVATICQGDRRCQQQCNEALIVFKPSVSFIRTPQRLSTKSSEYGWSSKDDGLAAIRDDSRLHVAGIIKTIDRMFAKRVVGDLSETRPFQATCSRRWSKTLSTRAQ